MYGFPCEMDFSPQGEIHLTWKTIQNAYLLHPSSPFPVTYPSSTPPIHPCHISIIHPSYPSLSHIHHPPLLSIPVTYPSSTPPIHPCHISIIHPSYPSLSHIHHPPLLLSRLYLGDDPQKLNRIENIENRYIPEYNNKYMNNSTNIHV